MNVKYYKKYIDKLIASNPVTISIVTEIKVPDGYNGFKKETVITNETVTFYDIKARREVMNDHGKSYTGISITKILARADADIKKGDTFTVDGTKYKVFFVKNLMNICKQIELEVIG